MYINDQHEPGCPARFGLGDCDSVCTDLAEVWCLECPSNAVGVVEDESYCAVHITYAIAEAAGATVVR